MSNAALLHARNIVGSWSDLRSNNIIIAPPLSNTKTVFKAIVGGDLIEKVHKADANVFAIALVGPQDFRSEESFARKVAALWRVNIDFSDRDDASTILEQATQDVVNKGKRPVLLIERFHHALEKLGEDIGTTLRNLENEFYLKTVVELPVSLAVLRERWTSSAASGKAPFLQSDWGQGHKSKLLLGYSEAELKIRLTGARAPLSELAKLLYSYTSGLPELVDRLETKAKVYDLDGFDKYVRESSLSYSERLIRWLDKPGEDIFSRLMANALVASDPKRGPISLKNHCWNEMLIMEDGSAGCRVLSIACAQTLSPKRQVEFSSILRTAGRKGVPDTHALENLLFALNANTDSSNGSDRFETFWASLALTASPFEGRWNVAEETLSMCEQINNKINCISPVELEKWRDVIGLMRKFDLEKKVKPQLRFEEFLCEKSDRFSVVAALRLLNFRLKRANDLASSEAIHIMISLPESLLQIAGFFKEGIDFRSFKGIACDAEEQSKRAFKRNFLVPKQGSRVDFVALLYMIYGCQIARNEKSIFDEGDLADWERHYEIRKNKVHSTSFHNESEWKIFRDACEVLLKKVWKSFDETESIDLIDPAEPIFKYRQ